VENKHQGDDRAVNATRRRLLKASAAAPLLASMAPNAALAMASATQCAGGDFNNRRANPDRDSAARLAVPFYRLPNELPRVQGLARTLYDINGTYYNASGRVFATSEGELVGLSYVKGETYVLALYDVSGGSAELAGYWPQIPRSAFNDTTATPLSGSCWTSLMAPGDGFA
jgi:hypothetical protein